MDKRKPLGTKVRLIVSQEKEFNEHKLDRWSKECTITEYCSLYDYRIVNSDGEAHLVFDSEVEEI